MRRHHHQVITWQICHYFAAAIVYNHYSKKPLDCMEPSFTGTLLIRWPWTNLLRSDMSSDRVTCQKYSSQKKMCGRIVTWWESSLKDPLQSICLLFLLKFQMTTTTNYSLTWENSPKNIYLKQQNWFDVKQYLNYHWIYYYFFFI